MQTPKDFYIFPEDLFRVGNSNDPRWNNVRPNEVETYDLNGIAMIRANGAGISVFSEDEVKNSSLSGWAWKVKKEVPLPMGLKMWSDRPGHWLIVPTQDMILMQYVALLQQLLVHSQKTFKLEKKL